MEQSPKIPESVRKKWREHDLKRFGEPQPEQFVLLGKKLPDMVFERCRDVPGYRCDLEAYRRSFTPKQKRYAVEERIRLLKKAFGRIPATVLERRILRSAEARLRKLQK